MGLSKYLPPEQLSESYLNIIFTLELERKKISVERILPAVSDAFILQLWNTACMGIMDKQFSNFQQCFAS